MICTRCKSPHRYGDISIYGVRDTVQGKERWFCGFCVREFSRQFGRWGQAKGNIGRWFEKECAPKRPPPTYDDAA